MSLHDNFRSASRLTRECTSLWLALLVASLMLTGCSRPPQIGSDEKAMKAVDALYTAISTRRHDLLDESAKRIDDLFTTGELPMEAFRELKPLIDEARDGAWEKSLRKLYDFIRGQRRTSV